MSHMVDVECTQCKAIDDDDISEYLWNILKSPLASSSAEEHHFCIWRLVCAMDTKLALGIKLTDFNAANGEDILHEQLQTAFLQLPARTSNWTFARILLHRGSRLDACFIDSLQLSGDCMQHVSGILLATFATITDSLQLELLFRLLEIATPTSKIAICTKLSSPPTQNYVSAICAPLLRVLESKTMLDAVPHMNRVMTAIGTDNYNFTLTMITNYPFATLHHNQTNDPTCIVRLPFSKIVKVKKLSNLTTLVIGVHDNNCTIGRYQSRPFLLAFDKASGILLWGQPIQMSLPKLIVNEHAIAVMSREYNECKDVCVYDLVTGMKTATLIKPTNDAQLSPHMDTWIVRDRRGAMCLDTITNRVKLHTVKYDWKRVRGFVFGLTLEEDWNKTLQVRFFTENELEVANCLAYAIHANLLVVLTECDAAVMVTLYDLRANGAHFKQLQVLSHISATSLEGAKIIAFDACGLVLQHEDGFLFINFNNTNTKNVALHMESWFHVRAAFGVVWMWDRINKQLTKITPDEMTVVGNVNHLFDIVHVDQDRVFVL